MEVTTELICTIAGPIIAALVSLFKKWSVVEKHPKWVALALSILTSVVSALTIGTLDMVAVAACTLVPFAGAVATYEVAKSATKGGTP